MLKQLRTHLSRNKQDAAAWYRRGMIAWALYDRDRVKGGAPGLDWTLLGREADLAIRTADAIDPTNIRYQLSKGQFFLGTGLVTMRVQSYLVFDHALENARKLGDSALIAEAAEEPAAEAESGAETETPPEAETETQSETETPRDEEAPSGEPAEPEEPEAHAG